MQSLLLTEFLIVLAAAVIITTMLRAFKLPTTVSYLVAGVVIGPTGMGLISQQESLHYLSEFGVVFLLFVLGLHFSLSRLVALRKVVFLLGGVQVLICGLCFFSITWLSGYNLATATILSGALALSSTAIVMKELADINQISTRHGTLSFGILLFQDFAAIFFIVMLPFLATTEASQYIEALFTTLAKVTLIVVIFLLVGRKLLPVLLNEISKTKSTELFVLTTLLIVILAAWIMHYFGFSYALGAFLAGMMLSESHYRHQVEADINPFKDVLLGLFFVSVGMLIDLNFFADYWKRILFFSVCLMLFKSVIITSIAMMLKESKLVASRTGILLCQGSEFGFVLITLAMQQSLLSADVMSFILSIIVISMMITPFLIRHNYDVAHWLLTKFGKIEPKQEEHETTASTVDLQDHVIICGCGSVGQVIGRFLEKEKIAYVAIDNDAALVKRLREAGIHAIFSNTDQASILNAANIVKARMLIISFLEDDKALKLIRIAKELNEELPILVRSKDDTNLEKLIEAGAAEVIPESYEGSMMIVSHVFAMLGFPIKYIIKNLQSVRERRYKILHGYFHNDSTMLASLTTPGKKILQSVHIIEESQSIGKTLKALNINQYNIEIQAIHRGDKIIQTPSLDERIKQNDIIIVYGLPADLESVEDCLTR